VAQTLANLGFPVRNLEFSGELVVRGCIVDKVSGAARALNPRAVSGRRRRRREGATQTQRD
jgi:hypothetical protein